MENKTRLELAHAELHHKIASLVSPPYTGTLDEYNVIKPHLDEAAEKFRLELLKNEKEVIEFIGKNRLEVESFFGDIMNHFKSQEIHDAIYSYYARNFTKKSKEEIELIIKQRCGV